VVSTTSNLEVSPVKRIVMFALPIVGTLAALGLAFLFLRTQSTAIGPRLAAAREAIGEAIEDVAEQIEEVLE
jgi:hypothetical protein